MPKLLKTLLHVLALAVFITGLAHAAGDASDEDQNQQQNSQSDQIISKYLEATREHQQTGQNQSVVVDINATIPKLKESGRLRALRKISSVGRVTYHVLTFQGDNTVKNQVIARYLQAEQQGQGEQNIAINATNYKFKFKGERETNAGEQVYVFGLSPRKKRVGLWKGEMWLDAASYLPVFEKGKLVKNPSIFFKRVEFERAYSIQNGVPLPQSMTSTIDTRIIGTVQLNVSYSNYEENSAPEPEGESQNPMQGAGITTEHLRSTGFTGRMALSTK